MTAFLLVWFSMAGLVLEPPGGQAPTVSATTPAPALRLDIRVFDGTTDVTRDTIVSLFTAGDRLNPQRIPEAPNGERQITLPAGQYDMQLLQHAAGRVVGVRWTSLRLLVAYPGEHGRHLEVVNMRPGFGALQVRRVGVAAELGRVGWTATLRQAGGGAPVGSGVPGDGYLLFLGPPGRYDIEVRDAHGETHWIRDAEIIEDLTYLKNWGG